MADGKDELSNVCVVISDLKATYEGGSQQILKALEDFRSEAGRSALTLEPVGLNTDEIYHILRKRLFEELPSDVLGVLFTKAWYMDSNREGELYFKNVQNLVAKLKTTAESYNRESSLKELRNFLANVFAPSMKDCYQEVLALPALDEIQMKPDKVSLLIYEPYTGGGLHPDLQQFYHDLDYKNRILSEVHALRGGHPLVPPLPEAITLVVVTTPSSIDWRSTSRTSRLHAGSSSKPSAVVGERHRARPRPRSAAARVSPPSPGPHASLAVLSGWVRSGAF